MKYIHQLYHLVVILLLLSISSCQSTDMLDEGDDRILFQLSYDNSILASYRSDLKDGVKVRYILSDEHGRVIDYYMSAYNSSQNMIVIEPLQRGKYVLSVLSYSRTLEDNGLIVYPNIESVSDTWFEINNENPFFSYDGYICYGQQSFEVNSNASITHQLKLSHVLSAIHFILD